jgi:hypothetical protein
VTCQTHQRNRSRVRHPRVRAARSRGGVPVESGPSRPRGTSKRPASPGSGSRAPLRKTDWRPRIPTTPQLHGQSPPARRRSDRAMPPRGQPRGSKVRAPTVAQCCRSGCTCGRRATRVLTERTQVAHGNSGTAADVNPTEQTHEGSQGHSDPTMKCGVVVSALVSTGSVP